MGMSPNADIFYGYVLPDFDYEEYGDLDCCNIGTLSTLDVVIAGCGWESRELMVAVPCTVNHAYDWGIHRLDNMTEPSKRQVEALIREAKRLKLPLPEESKFGWFCVVDYG